MNISKCIMFSGTPVCHMNVLFVYTRGIWKVRSIVFNLSNRFTNAIMYGGILKSNLSSML